MEERVGRVDGVRGELLAPAGHPSTRRSTSSSTATRDAKFRQSLVKMFAPASACLKSSGNGHENFELVNGGSAPPTGVTHV